MVRGARLSDYLSVGGIAKVFLLRVARVGSQAVRDEILKERAISRSGQRKARGAKGNMSNYKVRHRGPLSCKVHDWKPESLVVSLYGNSIVSRLPRPQSIHGIGLSSSIFIAFKY